MDAHRQREEERTERKECGQHRREPHTPDHSLPHELLALVHAR
jgi:hypothetical protein